MTAPRGFRDVIFRAVVVRVTGLPPDSVFSWWIGMDRDDDKPTRATRAGKEVPDLDELVTWFPRVMTTCTVRYEVSDGSSWNTVATSNGRDLVSNTRRSRGRIEYVLGAAIATKSGVAITATLNLTRFATRLVAVDRVGNEHRAVLESRATAPGLNQIVAEFDVAPTEVQDYRLQIRSFKQGEKGRDQQYSPRPREVTSPGITPNSAGVLGRLRRVFWLFCKDSIGHAIQCCRVGSWVLRLLHRSRTARVMSSRVLPPASSESQLTARRAACHTR